MIKKLFQFELKKEKPIEKLELAHASLGEINFNKKSFWIGLDWRILGNPEKPKNELTEARSEGWTHYVISSFGSLVGLAQNAVSDRLKIGSEKKSYSLALHISETVAQGGIEVYIFKINEEENNWAFVALNDSKPIPGFDVYGGKEDMLNLLRDFQVIKNGHLIRYFGNSNFHSEEEQIVLNDVLSNTSTESRIKLIPNYKLINYTLTLSILAVAILSGFLYWDSIRQDEINKKVQRELMDPNPKYESSLISNLPGKNNAGKDIIHAWIKFINALPLKAQGWSLETIECNLINCTLTWDRKFGSFADFYKAVPMGMISSSEFFESENPSKASIKTVHNLDFKFSEVVTSENLKPIRAVIQSVSSILQDLSLIAFKVKLTEPKLFPEGQTNLTIEQLNRPVVKGGWELNHEIASLESLPITTDMFPEKLIVELGASKDANHISYKLSGGYYGKSKDF